MRGGRISPAARYMQNSLEASDGGRHLNSPREYRGSSKKGGKPRPGREKRGKMIREEEESGTRDTRTRQSEKRLSHTPAAGLNCLWVEVQETETVCLFVSGGGLPEGGREKR